MAKRISTTNNRPRGPRLFSRPSPLAERNQNLISDLHTELQTAIGRSQFASIPAQHQIALSIQRDALAFDPYPAAVRAAFSECVSKVIRQSLAPLYSPPDITTEATPLAGHKLRDTLRQRLTFLQQEDELVSHWHSVLQSAFTSLARATPKQPNTRGALSFKIPLIGTLHDPVAVIDAVVRTFSTLAAEPTDHMPRPGAALAQTLLSNLLTASRVTYEEAAKRPHRITWPAKANLAPDELVEAYLANTPFIDFFNTAVDLVIDTNTLIEQLHIMAAPGHGKSQTLQSFVLQYLSHPDQPGILVMDSQGDAFKVLAKMDCFNPDHDDRLILISPDDPHPPALNLFSWNQQLADTLTPRQRETFLEGIIQSFVYIVAGLLGTEFTGKMEVLFRFVAAWLVHIPDCNINTLIDLLDDPQPYLQYIDELPPTAQSFIDQLYEPGNQYNQTRQQIQQRLYHLISNRSFERMFANTENKFDLGAALNDGKVVFIDTAKSSLQPAWSSMFGRYWVAQLLQTAIARTFIPRHERRLAAVLVDECHEYLDENVEALLYQARKFAISIHLIHQDIPQLREANVYGAVVGVPAVRLTGAISDADANIMAREMRTTPDFLKSVRKTNTSAEWALYVRNATPTATKVTMPFLEAERRPRMSNEAFERLLARNRALVGAPPQQHAPTTRGAPLFNNDGDAY